MHRASSETAGPGDDARGRVPNAIVRADAAGSAAPEPSEKEDPEPRRTLEQALGGVPRELRAVFVLREVEGYTHVEIGSMLGISAAASEVRLHQARELLREQLKGRQ